MDRTAEEFVHQLPGGRWFVGDLVGGGNAGEVVFLVEVARAAVGIEISLSAIPESRQVRLYRHKRSAKREAQRMIERVLGTERP